MNIRNEILDTIKLKPKHYTRIILKNPEMIKWIDNSCVVDINSDLKTKIRSALYKETNVCKYGNIMKCVRISCGFQCSASCNCVKEAIRDSVLKSKAKITKNKQHEINIKRKNTMVEKYGVEYNSRRPELKYCWKTPKIPHDIYSVLSNKEWMTEEYSNKNRSLVDIANELGVYYSTVADYCRRHGLTIRQRSNYSMTEKEIGNFIKQHVDIEENNRSVIDGLELDIFIPSKNIAIEVNGLYWHSHSPSRDKKEDRNKHLRKTLLCRDKNIQLIHITDEEWINRTEAVQTIILSKIGCNTRYYARNTIIKEVGVDDERKFLNKYHIQGYTSSKTCLGLYLDNELLMIASFSKNRFSNTNTVELVRMCSKKGITVVGGVSKLMKNSLYSEIYTFCDLAHGDGSGYSAANFTYLGDTTPGYFYTDGNKVLSRYKCQKHKLKDMLTSFDENKSESENMFSAGYMRYWNCGNSKWVFYNKV